jgi:hypothetical protein
VHPRFRAVVATALLSFLVAPAVAPTAAHAKSDVSTVMRRSALNAADKSLTVECPTGRVATGAQAFTNGDPYGVHLTEIWPSGRTVRVSAAVFGEVNPRPSWALTVTAMCVPQPAGYLVVQGEALVADHNTDDGRRFGVLSVANCPGGREMIGMGGRATGGYLTQLQPLGRGVPYTNDHTPRMHGVWVNGKARPWTASSAQVRAVAICAAPGNDMTFGHAERADTTARKSVTATCPTGTRLHAIGFVTFFPNMPVGQPFSYATLSRAFTTGPALTSVELIARRHLDPVATQDWGLVPQVLCG